MIWNHTYFNELKVEPSECPVMLTEAPLNPKENREKMVEIFFEKLKVPQFYVQVQAVLALYASGKTTGLVVDSGDGVTHFVAVYEGYSLSHATIRMDLAGRNLTQYVFEHAGEEGVKLKNTSDKEIAKGIKEKCCYVSQDYNTELAQFAKDASKKMDYTLPDGTVVKIGELRIKTPECLFQPKLLGFDFGGVPVNVKECISRCDIDLRTQLFSKIILSGGTTMFEGMQERLTKELQKFATSTQNVGVIAPVERKYSIWIGGSVLATMATFQSSWITAAEYAKIGAQVVHSKCF